MISHELIFFAGLSLCALTLIYLVVMQIIKTKKRTNSIDNAQIDYDDAIRERNLTKKKLMASITKVYGKEKANKVANGIIWIGMPMHLLLVAVGKANDIKESIYREKRVEKWYYGEYQTRLGTYKYKLEIIVENDEVVGWKDLV